MRVFLTTVMLVGCGFSPSATLDATNPTIDGSPDGSSGCRSYSTQLDTCAVGSGSNANLELAGNTSYNTDTNTLTLDGGSTLHPSHVVVTTTTGPVDVLIVGAFSLSGTFTVIGATPIGIAAAGDMAINGRFDVSRGGAGARSDTSCALAQSLGTGGANDDGGGGGGGGGSFQGAGGAGANGNKDDGPSVGGPGGIATARPTGLLGGCAGGKGGDGFDDTNGGLAGRGGGAVLLASPGTITIGAGGIIDAGGGGGHGGRQDDGGGGGGASGGMILLECGSLRHMGVLAANGGGGGEGSDVGDDGDDGNDATTTMMLAMGGSGDAGNGGDGGAGAAGPMTNGGDATQLKDGGGGGGGGGGGFIAINSGSMMGPGMISPPFAAWP